MTADDRARAVPRRFVYLLAPRDWAYVLALLVPFVVYGLFLKANRIVALPEGNGPLEVLGLMRSDLLFEAGYSLLWVGLFAVAKGGLSRVVVVMLFHATTIAVALIETAAARFYGVTGSTLDAQTILFFLSSPAEAGTVAASETSPLLVVQLAAALSYAVFGPWLIARLLGRRRGWQGPWQGAPRARRGGRPKVTWPGSAGTALASCLLVALSLAPAGGSASASESFARDAFVNAALTGLETDKPPPVDAKAVRESLPLGARLSPQATTGGSLRTPAGERNVVLIFLESTGARAVTPYNEDLGTTPFLDELSKQSLFADRAYAAMPHTTNAQTASVCGIDPPTREQTDSLGDRIPSTCLPELLSGRGYKSAYFQAATKDFERRPEVVENMGYDEFYPLESMDVVGFERANYFGYEDDIMLGPSREWLEKNADDGPFFATYNTITPHHQYLAPDRYGTKDFAEKDGFDRYLNCVRYVDYFVQNLIEQYKALGLYEDTIFVIQGDHGEAFGEHGRYQHDNVIWEEGLRIPLMILDPSRDAERVEAPVGELDVLPTVVDALGYRVEGGEYPGRSMLDPLPKDRTIMASCWYEDECLASVKGDQKYIYHFGDRPEEFYDLSEDPEEKENIASEVPSKELRTRREELLGWRARADAAYFSP